ncbi:MAG: hypothetical protein ACK4ZW_16315 [Blastomonas sp.]
MTLEQKLGAWIDGFAHHGAAELSEALGPVLTEGALARMWLAERLADMARETPRLPAGFADPVCQSVVILDHARVHLSLAMISAAQWKSECDAETTRQEIVGFADGWTTIRFLAAPGARIQRHILSQTSEGWRATRETPEAVVTGQSIRLNNAIEALQFVDVVADVIMLRLFVRDPDLQEAIECNARTGTVVRVREAQSRQGRIRMILSLLRAMGRRDAVPLVARAMASWPGHLRWHAVREALATDSQAGFALLQTMAKSDPEAQVRALASRTRDDLMVRYPQLAT